MSWRDRLVKWSFTLLFLGICVRLVFIMGIQHGHYAVLAQQQHRVENEISAERGEISAADGTTLVVNADTYLIFAVPKEMDDVATVKKQIVATTLGLLNQVEPLAADKIVSPKVEDATDNLEVDIQLPEDLRVLKTKKELMDAHDRDFDKILEAKLAVALDDHQNMFVQLLQGLTPIQKESFVSAELSGLYFQRNPARSYPEGNLAASVLGFVGKDGDGNDRGYFGLEGYFERDLSGRAGYTLVEQDIAGKRIPLGISKISDSVPGRDLKLTVRRELQYLLEKKLNEGVKKYRAKSGTAIIVDPNDGAVLAMASAPGFDPAYWSYELGGETDVSKVETFRNLAIADNYEPGSVIKPLTMSMALSDGAVTPESTYHDDGPVTYSGYQVRTWNNKYHGEITMSQILQLSNNTGAAWLGHQVGFDQFNKYLSEFRLGVPTGIELQGEESGIVRDHSQWRDIDLANMSFGQGISVTPIQLTTIFSALVNGGELYKPRIVQSMVDYSRSGAVAIDRMPELVGRPITPEVSREIRLMLQNVVRAGEFTWFVKQAGMDRYSIGGKTGTAQIPVNGQYDPNKTNVTFIGFGPVDQPRFVMLFKLTEPSTSTYSAETVVPLWMETARELMIYFGIAPTQ